MTLFDKLIFDRWCVIMMVIGLVFISISIMRPPKRIPWIKVARWVYFIIIWLGMVGCTIMLFPK